MKTKELIRRISRLDPTFLEDVGPLFRIENKISDLLLSDPDSTIQSLIEAEPIARKNLLGAVMDAMLLQNHPKVTDLYNTICAELDEEFSSTYLESRLSSLKN